MASTEKPATRLWSSVVGVIAVAAILLGINALIDTRLPNAQADLRSSGFTRWHRAPGRSWPA